MSPRFFTLASWRSMVVGAAFGVMVAPHGLLAQGMITNAKNAAQNAVAASNAQTAAMQNTEDPKPTSVVISTPAPRSTPRYVPVPPAPSTAKHTAAPTATAQVPAPAKSVATKPAPVSPTPAVPAVAPVADKRMVMTPGHAAAPAKGAPGGMPAPTPAAPKAPPAISTDSGARSISVTHRGAKGQVSLNREVYSYASDGRRDPFLSLMQNGELRPLISDLRLVAVLYDPTGRNSVAVLNDVASPQTKTEYRVRVGQTLGRMRVSQIEPKQVVFTIEQVGFSRQETLALGDSTTARTQ